MTLRVGACRKSSGLVGTFLEKGKSFKKWCSYQPAALYVKAVTSLQCSSMGNETAARLDANRHQRTWEKPGWGMVLRTGMGRRS